MCVRVNVRQSSAQDWHVQNRLTPAHSPGNVMKSSATCIGLPERAQGSSLFPAIDHTVMINGMQPRMAVDPRPICTMYTLRQCLRKARLDARGSHTRLHARSVRVLQETRTGIRYTNHYSCIFVTPSMYIWWTCTLDTCIPFIWGVSWDLFVCIYTLPWCVFAFFF